MKHARVPARTFGVFAFGCLAGVGLTLIATAQLIVDHANPNTRPGLVPAFVSGIGLLAAGLWGGWRLATGRRWSLRAAMLAVAGIALWLGMGLTLRRRADRLYELSTRYNIAAGRLEMGLVRASVSQAQARTALITAHANQRMSGFYRKAAARPWLPVPRFRPCTCEMCTAGPSVGIPGSPPPLPAHLMSKGLLR